MKIDSIEKQAQWRILRIDTIVDLILIEFSSFLDSMSGEKIYKIIQYDLMLKYNLRNGVLPVEAYIKSSFTPDTVEVIMNDLLTLYANESLAEKHASALLYNEFCYLKELRNYRYDGVIEKVIGNIILMMIHKFEIKHNT